MKATTVLLFLSASVSTAVATPIIQREATNYTTPTEGRTVTVMKGDTLFSIPAYLDLGACDIVAANNIKDPNTIVVGTLLKVPAATEKKDHESCISQPSPQQREKAVAHPCS
ncbi:hypothetical protein B5807_01226 [Epicoccum nigrum]|uniref:LysM domain-containing protein n=1 Tax=Epicoccum nigrum TaxID=105696 RepID=A0A1Y2MCR8_EPING|nr:hypothetical protein B5807_01226 [Epicoccum nigrum]